MSERITKSMARNIYFGGSAFAILVFVGLTLDTVAQVPKLSHSDKITESVAKGKKLVGSEQLRWLSHNHGGGSVLRA